MKAALRGDRVLGWTVVPGKFYKPRVVSGSGGSKALVFMMEGRPRVLNEREVEKVVKGLEALCRDVVD